jgi:hypothetical protein
MCNLRACGDCVHPFCALGRVLPVLDGNARIDGASPTQLVVHVPSVTRFALLLTALAAASGCGARTPLLVAGAQGQGDATAEDAPSDGVGPEFDAASDSPEEPPLDAPLEGQSKAGCAEAGTTYIYVVTSDSHLYSFDPPSAAFTQIGVLACPGQNGRNTNSMAVDRLGVAYVSLLDGSLYRVSTATASCRATSFVPGQRGWGKYGMGFATNATGPTETLFVAEASYTHPSLGLATIDTTSFAFRFVGPFSNSLGDAIELTGTGDGRLFGFFLASPGPGGDLVQIDETNATILSVTTLPIGTIDSAFAFSFWGGDFYFFIAPGYGTTTTVTRYRPSDKTLVVVASLAQEAVVGAGASTCAPAQ